MSKTARPTPVHRAYWTPGAWVLALFFSLGLVVYVARFVLGLDDVTNLDQQHPWGLWIGFDLLVGVDEGTAQFSCKHGADGRFTDTHHADQPDRPLAGRRDRRLVGGHSRVRF